MLVVQIPRSVYRSTFSSTRYRRIPSAPAEDVTDILNITLAGQGDTGREILEKTGTHWLGHEHWRDIHSCTSLWHLEVSSPERSQKLSQSKGMTLHRWDESFHAAQDAHLYEGKTLRVHSIVDACLYCACYQGNRESSVQGCHLKTRNGYWIPAVEERGIMAEARPKYYIMSSCDAILHLVPQLWS